MSATRQEAGARLRVVGRPAARRASPRVAGPLQQAGDVSPSISML